MNSESILQKKSFLGFVPNRLEIEGRPELNLFPLNILFVGFRTENEKTIMGSSIYEPDLASFKQKGEMLTMEYDNIYGESWVVIEYNMFNKHYLGKKYINGKFVLEAAGIDWHMFFTHLTLRGLSNFERCKFEAIPLEKN